MMDEILYVGDYVITRLDSGDYWIEQKGGEGMMTSREKFEKLIVDFYNAEF